MYSHAEVGERKKKLPRYAVGPTLTRGAPDSFVPVGAGKTSLFRQFYVFK